MIDRAHPRPTRATLVVGALLGAAVLAGCGAGQVTQTDNQATEVEGGNATTGPIAVRNATLEFDAPATGGAVYPVGASAPLTTTIVNTGVEADRIVAASSPVASSVQISGVRQIAGGRSLTVEGAPAPAAPAPAPGAAPADGAAAPEAGTTDAPAPGEAPAPPAAPTPGEATAPGEPPAPAEAPAPAALQPDPEAPGQASIVLNGLREDVRSGRTYPVVLTFERAGDVRVEVPVALPGALREDAHA